MPGSGVRTSPVGGGVEVGARRKYFFIGFHSLKRRGKRAEGAICGQSVSSKR